MPFENILNPNQKLVQIDTRIAKAGRNNIKSIPRGCDHCPAKKMWKKGYRPVMGNVTGTKRLFVWAQNPGRTENRKKKELVGNSGKFFWREMKRVRLTREDCEIQNAIRCMTVEEDDRCMTVEEDDNGYMQGRTPNKTEIHCCSIYNEQALAKSKAKIYLFLGQLAAKQILGREFRKDKKIFWSNKLDAKIICLDHPSYFLRGGIPSRLKEFRAGLRAVSEALKGKITKYGNISKLDIIPVYTVDEAVHAAADIRTYTRRNIRIGTDLEDDYYLDDFDERVALVYGFAPTGNKCYVFVLDHPENPQPLEVINEVKEIVAGLLADKTVKKVYHHGSYDIPETKKEIGIVRGYDYDTNYSEYLNDSSKRSYSLEEITIRHYPEYAGYKEMPHPEASPAGMSYQEARKKGLLRMSKVPLEKLIPYNGMDCIISKRREIATKNKISQPLLKTFMDAAFVIDKMEKFGPIYDYRHHAVLEKIYPVRVKQLTRKIRMMVGNSDYNPNSPVQVAKVMYDQFKFPCVDEENPRGTGDEILTLLTNTTGHPYPKLQQEFRTANTIATRSLKAYKESADLHEGRLRTKWWLTGAITGRLRSGGGSQKDRQPGIVNLQNIDNNPFVKNLVVSDTGWREPYQVWYKEFKKWCSTYPDIAKYIWLEIKDEYSDAKKKKLKRKRDHALDLWWRSKPKEFWGNLVELFSDLDIFLARDYSQIEVRVLAQLSEDPDLIAAFERGDDIHCYVGTQITPYSMEKIKEDVSTRVLIKGIHFAIIFGKKPPGIYADLVAAGIKTSMKKVQRFYDAYFGRFKKVRKFIEDAIACADENGYVETAFGFKRPIDKNSSDRNTFWENQAVNCVDYGTEILTQRGWLKGYEVKIGDIALTKNIDTDLLEWQSVQRVNQYPDYEGKVVRLRSKTFDSICTMNHRWMVRTHYKDSAHPQDVKNLCISTKDMLKKKWAYWIHRTGSYNGPDKSSISDDLVELAGWVLTDGWFKNGDGYASNMVGVCQTKKENKILIDALFERLGIPFRRSVVIQKTGHTQWLISGLNGGWFKALFPNRILTDEFLNTLSLRQLRLLLKTMMRGDGTGPLAGTIGIHRNASDRFSCRTEKQADMFQKLCTLCGYLSYKHYRDMSKFKRKKYKSMKYLIPNCKGIWNVSVNRREFTDVSFLKEEYGKVSNGVWCPTVPNGYWVARRKGRVFITGNSEIQGSAHNMVLMALALLKRKPKTYNLLAKKLQMEVHDALDFVTKFRKLPAANKQLQHLTDVGVLKVVRDEFKVNWKVPLKSDGSAGFRLGVMVDLGEEISLPKFINEWCIENFKIERKLQKELDSISVQ